MKEGIVNFLYLILAIIIILVVVNKFNNRGIHYMDIQTAQELIKDSTVTVIECSDPAGICARTYQRSALNSRAGIRRKNERTGFSERKANSRLLPFGK